MRILSAAQIKLKLKGKKGRTPQVKPREGTKIRELYDKLMAAPGRPIELSCVVDDPSGSRLAQLEKIYGLDIRIVRQGSSRVHRKSLWVLAGEWFGSIYIDYTAETEEQMDRLAEARYALQHAERVENILPDGVHRLSKDSQEILDRVATKGRELAAKHLKPGS